MLLEEVKSGALVPVLNDFLSKRYSIDALYPHREHLPAKVRTFIDVVAKNFHHINWDPCARDSKRPTAPKKPSEPSKNPRTLSDLPATG
jgi:hypothetical protein